MNYFLFFILGILSLLCIFCLLRLILGPTVADRLLAVNMLGGIVISAIVVLSLLLRETYLLDISFIYALISFLAVVVLTQIYITASHEQKVSWEKNASEEECVSDECY